MCSFFVFGSCFFRWRWRDEKRRNVEGERTGNVGGDLKGGEEAFGVDEM